MRVHWYAPLLMYRLSDNASCHLCKIRTEQQRHDICTLPFVDGYSVDTGAVIRDISCKVANSQGWEMRWDTKSVLQVAAVHRGLGKEGRELSAYKVNNRRSGVADT